MLDMPFLLTHNVLDLLNELKQIGFGIYGAAMEGEPIQEMIFPVKRVCS